MKSFTLGPTPEIDFSLSTATAHTIMALERTNQLNNLTNNFPFESHVRTVARPLQVISLLRLRASGTGGWSSGRLIFYMQFPYLLSARSDHGRLTFGRLSLNCDFYLMGERVRTGIYVVRTVAAIFPYLNLERKFEALSLRVI
jgi:hypothetical protein